MPISCVLVDDDHMARTMLEYMVKRSGIFTISGSFSSPVEALDFLQNQNETDVLFLDIDMPYFSGMELRKKLKDVPLCVFISSHPEYAVQTYELETLDFIQKPIKWERFEKTIQKIKDKMNLHQKAEMYDEAAGNKMFYIRQNEEQIKINIYKIIYLESLRNNVILHTKSDEYKIVSTMNALLERDEFSSFIRIHKSYALQQFYIKKVFFDKLQLKNGQYLPIGRKFKANLEVIVK